MNDKRRKKLKVAMLHIDTASQIIEDATFDEQDCLDNIPDNLQESDAGIKMEDAISALEDASDMLNDVNDLILTAMA